MIDMIVCLVKELYLSKPLVVSVFSWTKLLMCTVTKEGNKNKSITCSYIQIIFVFQNLYLFFLSRNMSIIFNGFFAVLHILYKENVLSTLVAA